jgi:hypothetical protein
MPINLDSASKTLTLISLAIAVMAAWKALPLDAELKNLQGETQRLDNELKVAAARLKEAEVQLKEAESSRKLSFDLYQEVKKVLEKKDRTPRDEEALKVLVESLADDPLRYKLLSVLAVSATTPEVKKSATESSMFYRQEAELTTRQPETIVKATIPESTGGNIGSYDIDIFYCAAMKETSEPITKQILNVRLDSESGRWRSRLLPESVNQQPGYGVISNEIRYNAPGELPVAKILQQRLKDKGIDTVLKESLQLTKWYVSIFICQ